MKISLKTSVFNFFRQIFKIQFFEKLLVKLTVNKPFEAFIVKFIPNNYQYDKNTFRYVARNGINYKLDLYDYIDWWIYFGICDSGRDRLYTFAKSNDVIIDVGTNVGETLMNFANLTLPLGEVHGFEPDTINHQRCAENLKLNNLKNITLNKVGLGNTSGQFNIMVETPSNRGGNKIINQSAKATSETIRIITLDEYVETKELKKINLIKIDVEGFELNVLKGAEKTIKFFKPILFIELDDNNLREQGGTAVDLISLLLNLNYTIKNAQTDIVVDLSTNFNKCHFDIVCKSA